MFNAYKDDIVEIRKWYNGKTRTEQILIKYIGAASMIIISLILEAFVSGWFFITFVLGIVIIAHDVIRQQRQEMKADAHALEDSRKKLAEAKARSRKAYEERKQTEQKLDVSYFNKLKQKSGIEQRILDQQARIAKDAALRSHNKQINDLKDEIKFIKTNIIKKNKYYG